MTLGRGGGARPNAVYAVDACRTPIGKISGAEHCSLADAHVRSAGLRDVYIGAQRVGLCDAEEQRAAGIDQSASIDIAQRDDAGEGRSNLQVGL